MDVSHPSSKNYGKHWTAEEVEKTFAPSDEAVTRVRQWLESLGIAPGRILQTTDALTIGATSQEAEHLLKAQYHSWEHANTEQRQAACDLYHVPEHLKEHIEFVTPGTTLLTPAFDHDNREARLVGAKPVKTSVY